MRHSKQLLNGGESTVTTHHWDGSNMVLESSTNGSTKAGYIRGLGLVAQQVDDQKYFYLHNGHGDVVQRVDALGNVLHTYKHDAFGNEISPAFVGDPLNPIWSDPNPFRYCGEYFDDETGEIYLRARYYNPASGRFGSEDPAQDGLNWYLYCVGNPVRFIDPFGLAAKSKGGFWKWLSEIVNNSASSSRANSWNGSDGSSSRPLNNMSQLVQQSGSRPGAGASLEKLLASIPSGNRDIESFHGSGGVPVSHKPPTQQIVGQSGPRPPLDNSSSSLKPFINAAEVVLEAPGIPDEVGFGGDFLFAVLEAVEEYNEEGLDFQTRYINAHSTFMLNWGSSLFSGLLGFIFGGPIGLVFGLIIGVIVDIPIKDGKTLENLFQEAMNEYIDRSMQNAENYASGQRK